jgi:hypothetical protein
MIEFIKQWIEFRRALRRRWQMDARLLVEADPIGAYYEAQRRALSCRARGNAREHWHWAKVASEVVRIEPRAEMDFTVVKTIADQEHSARR